MRKMHIRIRPNGRTDIRVEGAVGAECEGFTRAFEAALGKLERRDFTKDYHREALAEAERLVEAV